MRAPIQALILPYVIEDGRLLVAVFHRSDADCWQFVSGGAEDDETPMEAALRECHEEIGTPLDAPMVQLQNMCYIPADIYNAKHWSEDVILVAEYSFALRMPSKELTLSDEHSEFRWLEPDAAASLLKYDSNRTALYELKTRLRLGRI